MRDWSEQEEQEMIERAKSGDPQANYELSLWAQERSEEEPDEPRWNRLAAKCLVKAAQAGYGPAQERMAEILQQSAAGKAAGKAAPPQEEDMPEPVHISEARQSARQQTSRRSDRQQPAARRPVSTRRPPVREEPEDDGYDDEEPEDSIWDDEEDDRPARSARRRADKKSAALPFSQWGDSQWRKMEMICIGVCAILLIAIAVIFISGRTSKSEGGSGAGVPAAGQVGTNDSGGSSENGETGGNGGEAAEPTPLPEDYPDEDTMAAIRSSELEVLPADQEYVLAPTTATVSVGSTTLRLRYGPSTTYDQVVLDDGSRASMPDGTKVEVFAKKGDWWMVRYEGKFGWCSKEYLIEDAEAASVG